MPFIPHTSKETQEMLSSLGLHSLDELFADIPQDMRPKSFNLPQGLDEETVCAKLEEWAGANTGFKYSFLGAGFYDHAIPKAIDALSNRGEFLTAYTPYQAEASQGTLQAIFEYQTAVARLLDMDAANASVYDAGSALFEAVMMAARAVKKTRFILDEGVHPLYRAMLKTLTANLSVELVTVPLSRGLPDLGKLTTYLDDGQSAAVIAQNPNFFGAVTDYTELFQHARAQGALSILGVYPVMQSVLKTPGEMGADIAVADGQSIGQPLNFGGPYLGIMACSKALIRQLPGRIVGRTLDMDGKTGYVLTLQAREQHIRRAKATSNICSNQALCALRSLMHLSLLGPEGLAGAAGRCIELAHYAAEKLAALPGVSRLNDAPFANEFAVKLPRKAEEATALLIQRGILPGALPGRWYKDNEHTLLIACTEKNTEAQINAFAKVLRECL